MWSCFVLILIRGCAEDVVKILKALEIVGAKAQLCATLAQLPCSLAQGLFAAHVADANFVSVIQQQVNERHVADAHPQYGYAPAAEGVNVFLKCQNNHLSTRYYNLSPSRIQQFYAFPP